MSLTFNDGEEMGRVIAEIDRHLSLCRSGARPQTFIMFCGVAEVTEGEASGVSLFDIFRGAEDWLRQNCYIEADIRDALLILENLFKEGTRNRLREMCGGVR